MKDCNGLEWISAMDSLSEKMGKLWKAKATQKAVWPQPANEKYWNWNTESMLQFVCCVLGSAMTSIPTKLIYTKCRKNLKLFTLVWHQYFHSSHFVRRKGQPPLEAVSRGAIHFFWECSKAQCADLGKEFFSSFNLHRHLGHQTSVLGRLPSVRKCNKNLCTLAEVSVKQTESQSPSLLMWCWATCKWQSTRCNVKGKCCNPCF